MHSIQIIYLSLTFLASISIQCNSLNLRGAQVVSHTALKVASTNDDVLHMADGAVVPVEPVPNRRRMTTIGTVRVLVVRVTRTDSDTGMSNLADYIFDTDTNSGEGINVQSQFDECSNGAFQFTPYNGETLTGVNVANGMYDYHITDEARVSTDIRDEVSQHLDTTLGILDEIDHVMLCLPPGTPLSTSRSETHWTAYARRGGKFTVYNDGAHTHGLSACAQSSTIMHEIGHNLGLHHSDRYDDGEHRRYEDKSGLMGTSYNLPDGRGPKMCYNAPHLKQLDWVDDSNIRTMPQASLTTSYTIRTLYGVYSERGNEGINRREMIILPELTSASNPGANNDYFISYNAMKGPNTGTRMGGNAVLVHHSSGVGRSSKLVAQLRFNHPHYSNEYSILINSEYITIKVIEINTVSGYAEVGVKVGNDTQLETPAPYSPLTLELPACTGDSSNWKHSTNPIMTCGFLFSSRQCSIYGDRPSDDSSTANTVCPQCGKCSAP